jgi:F-type H+-transporting ATPase subunit gamma
MASTRELRRRIRSVKNTAQITKAMQMVAATKMRRAQTQALGGRPYNQSLNYAFSQLMGKIDISQHKLLQPNDSKNIGIILITTDKALCGALNTNVLRMVQNFTNGRHPELVSGSQTKEMPKQARLNDYLFYTVGKKGRQFLVRTGKTLEADFENHEKVDFTQARQIARVVKQAFLEGKLGEVYVVYPDFISTLRQEPRIVKLLPIDPEAIMQLLKESESQRVKESKISKPLGTPGTSEFLFEPNLDDLLDYLLNHFLEIKIYQGLLETKASEHSARMMAMQNATDNAKELVSDLTLAYNQTRQDAITRELLEITTAGLALE